MRLSKVIKRISKSPVGRVAKAVVNRLPGVKEGAEILDAVLGNNQRRRDNSMDSVVHHDSSRAYSRIDKRKYYPKETKPRYKEPVRRFKTYTERKEEDYNYNKNNELVEWEQDLSIREQYLRRKEEDQEVREEELLRKEEELRRIDQDLEERERAIAYEEKMAKRTAREMEHKIREIEKEYEKFAILKEDSLKESYGLKEENDKLKRFIDRLKEKHQEKESRWEEEKRRIQQENEAKKSSFSNEVIFYKPKPMARQAFMPTYASTITGKTEREPVPFMEESSFRDSDDDLCCKLTGKLLNRPVITPQGVVYEQKVIEQWLKTSNKCPVTKQPLSLRDLKTDYDTLERILERGSFK